MGNRSFLYLVDRLPTEDGDEPEITAHVGESNNSMPALFQVLLSEPLHGPAQDRQQIFFPSSAGGIYSDRRVTEERLFKLLEFLGQSAQIERLRSFLGGLPGVAYSGDVNEWLYMIGEGSGDDLDALAAEFTRNWRAAQYAMDRGERAVVERIYEIDPANVANSLGLDGMASAADPDDDEEEGNLHGSCAGHDLYRFADNGLIGLRRGSAEGPVVLPALYSRIMDFDPGCDVGFLEQDERWGVYHKSGEIVMKPQLDTVYSYCEHAALVVWHERYGYLDKSGSWLAEPQYEDAFDYSMERAQVTLGGLAGYLDEHGELLIEPQFLDAGDFIGFSAIVETEEGSGAIDRKGNFMVPPRYEHVEHLKSVTSGLVSIGLFLIEDGGKGVWSATENRELLPCEYEDLLEFGMGDASFILAYSASSGFGIWCGDAGYTACHYDWIEAKENRELQGEGLHELADIVTDQWQLGSPVYGYRDGTGWRLFVDGTEMAETEYQARLAAGTLPA